MSERGSQGRDAAKRDELEALRSQLRQISNIAFSIAPASVRIADIQRVIEKSKDRVVKW